jgi:branched-chain amino acid transport system permease protein
MALVAACFLMLLVAAPGASAATLPSAVPAADSGTSIKGTLEGPTDKPVPKVRVTVKQKDASIGSATTNAKGEWEVKVPEPGDYTVTLDVSTLPKNLQLRNKGGETLPDVTVRPGSARTVIFPLIPTSQQQESEEGSSGSSTEGSSNSGGTDQGSTDTGDTGAPAAGQPPINPQDSSTPFLNRFLQMTVEGIKLGAIIAITAVGLSLVFGTTGLINFAHGELVTIGAVVAYVFSTSPMHLPLVLATAIAVAVGALVGGVIEVSLWRPMRKKSAGLIQMFIISIGLSLLLRHLILTFFGSRRNQYSQYTVQETVHLGPIQITPRDLFVTGLSVLVLFGVAYMLQRTRIGKATRAVSDNTDLAEASGIDVNKVILTVWVIGGGLAALGGVFYGLTQAVYWDMGFNLLLLMFAGVILGGLGSAYGAMVGSFVVGLVAQLSTLWFPVELQNAWALLALIVVLLLRPQGILGRAERAG